MGGRGRGQGQGKGGGTKVKVTIKTKVKDLEALNLLVNEDCDVELTWGEFFLQRCDIVVDPNRFVVKSMGKDSVKIQQKVRDLIGKFKKIRAFYRVDVVENRNRTIHTPQAPPQAQRATTTTSPSKGRVNSPKAQISPKKVAKNIKKEVASSAASSRSSTATQPIHGRRQTKKASKTRNPVFEANRHPPNNNAHQSQSSPTRRYEEDAALNGQVFSELRGINFDEDDDNASQLTTASQDSQDDLEELGITMEDLKPKVVKRLMTNVSNLQMLYIRNELRKIMDGGKWTKYSSRAPRASNFLIDLFRLGSN